MGCGKSSVGRKLSQLLCCRFIDLDEVVEARAGKSVSEIFEEDGEAAFRSLELESLKGILCEESARQWTPLAPSHFVGPSPSAGVRRCQFRPIALPNSETHVSDMLSQKIFEGDTAVVLALGGGTVKTPECAEMVRENTCCIYLRASVDTLLERLSSETSTRPLLTIDSHSAYSTKNDANSTSLHEVELNTPSRGTESDRSSQEPESNTSPRGAEGSGNMRHRIESLMSARTTTYEKAAHSIIDTDGKSIEQICSEILG